MTDTNIPNSIVSNISNTAGWVAYFRALETRQPDALCRDPYAERPTGEPGFQIANMLSEGNKHERAARACLFDQFALREIQNGVDLVNLAAGLDVRETDPPSGENCVGSIKRTGAKKFAEGIDPRQSFSDNL
jgi:O-methyltransferase involved in polyketide biosynthesis